GVTIEAIHHTRKAKGDDPLEDISGTFGLSAACDWYSVMRHHEDGAGLHVGGRLWDREQRAFQIRRTNQRWELVGPFNALTQVQQDTLYAIKQAGSMTPTDGARFWNISKQAAQKRFDQLVDHGVAMVSKGVYTTI